MKLLKWLFESLADFDFRRNKPARSNNTFYINRYSNLYSMAESSAHYTGD